MRKLIYFMWITVFIGGVTVLFGSILIRHKERGPQSATAPKGSGHVHNNPANFTFAVSEDGRHSSKSILVWNRPKWLFQHIGPQKDQFEKLGCSVTSCRLFDKKSFPRNRYNDVDAIFFNVKDMYLRQYPVRMRPDQIWIADIIESPSHWFPVKMNELRDFFNLTYTFMDDPDTDIVDHPTYIPRNKDKNFTIKSAEFVRNKTKMAAWVVSNCKGFKGQRRRYVSELSKYIDVDIYGACGKNCSRNGNSCFKKIESEYFYYFAFENAYCDDYATEKLHRTLGYDIIPVTLGGANYTRHAPVNSIIDVRDFASPKHLAQYLVALSKDTERYLEYFAWRKHWVKSQKHGLCKLCEILHMESYPYKTNFDIANYWSAAKHCKVGKSEGKALHLDKA